MGCSVHLPLGMLLKLSLSAFLSGDGEGLGWVSDCKWSEGLHRRAPRITTLHGSTQLVGSKEWRTPGADTGDSII